VLFSLLLGRPARRTALPPVPEDPAGDLLAAGNAEELRATLVRGLAAVPGCWPVLTHPIDRRTVRCLTPRPPGRALALRIAAALSAPPGTLVFQTLTEPVAGSPAAFGPALGPLAVGMEDRLVVLLAPGPGTDPAAARVYELVGLAARAWRALAARSDARMLPDQDRLTGVLRREALLAELGRLVEMGGPLSLLVVDVDRLRLTNARLGRPAGDLVLVDAARAISRTVRRLDPVGRVGGDSFAVALPSADPESALPVAERIREAVRAASAATVSAGLAGAQYGETAEALLARAEGALAYAQTAGSDGLAIESPERAVM
jgi:diguanylate cyclase (GGDEF)-like protein